MRIPSIHITNQALKLILEEYLGDESNVDIKDLVKYVTQRAFHYRLSKRGILESNNKIKKKTERLRYTEETLAELFNARLILARRKRRHSAITKAKPGDFNWPHILTASGYAAEFCKGNDLEYAHGFDLYINISLDLMPGKFRYNFWSSNHERVVDKYELKHHKDHDPYSELSKQIHDIYCAKLFELSYHEISYEDDPQYRYFIMAAEICKKMGLQPEDYVQAQFDTMNNIIPIPVQFITDNARTRLIRWLANNNIKKINKGEPDWDSLIKRAKDGDYT